MASPGHLRWAIAASILQPQANTARTRLTLVKLVYTNPTGTRRLARASRFFRLVNDGGTPLADWTSRTELNLKSH